MKTYAYHKGHNAGLQRRPLTEKFNTPTFQAEFEAGHAAGLVDADKFDAFAKGEK